MAINQTKLDTTSVEIGRQIGRHMAGLYYRLRRRPKTVEFSETFDVWKLSIKNLPKAIESSKFPAYKTKFQHHQIRLGRSAKGYARSVRLGPGTQRVFKVGLSRIAERIDEAITRLDDYDKGDSRARLFVVPSFRIYAFWLVDRHEVYVVSTPDRFKTVRRGGKLHRGQILSTKDFLRYLNEAIGPFTPAEGYRRRRRL